MKHSLLKRFIQSLQSALLCTGLLAEWTSLEAAFRRINHDNPRDPTAAKIFQLENELTVYLTENHQSPRFTAEIAVRVGSTHDPVDSTGLAHYLEHMLFKGTKKMGTLNFEKERAYLERISDLYEQHFRESNPEKRKAIYSEINAASQLASRYAIPNEMDKLYKAMGETGLNAHTHDEETVYTVNLPANRLRQWALIESDRFQNPVFRLFQAELEVVYEEKNQALDNEGQILEDAVRRILFKKHPYGQQTVIGDVEHLKNPSLKNLHEFFGTHYVPNNMAVLISGDVNTQEAIQLIDEHFASWKSKPLPLRKIGADPPPQSVERVTVKYQGEESVLLAFRLSPRNHPDTEILKLVDMTLDNSVAGLININLNQKQRVRRAGSSVEFMNDHGMQYLWGIPKKGQPLKEVEALLLTQLKVLQEGQFDDWILHAIITDFKKSRKASLESDDARVALMRSSFLSFADWDHTVGELDRMEKLTKQDLVRAARKYYKGGFVAGYRVDAQHELPSIQKPDIERINIDPSRQSDFAKEVLSMPVENLKPVFVKPGVDFQKQRIQEGMNFYYSRNPLNDLFSLTFSIELGTRENNRIGIASLFLDKSGTRQMPLERLKKEWYKLGTDFAITPGETETTLTLSGLDENLTRSLRLLSELLQEPSAEPAVLAELKKIIIAQRLDLKKDFRTIGSALSAFGRYGTNSPQLRALSNDALQSLQISELHNLTRTLLDYKHAIGYTGALPKETVIELLKTWRPREGPLKSTPAHGFLSVQSVPTNRVFFLHKEMAQAQIQVDLGGDPFDEGSQTSIQLFNEYFSGGMSGVVFQELRESRALAYSAGAIYFGGARKGEQSTLSGHIGCQADKAIEAIAAFMDLLQTLPASKERFEESRDAVINRYRTSKLGFREVLGAVRSWERLEIPIDPRSHRFHAVKAAELETLLEFHRHCIKDKNLIISLVGDRSKIRIGALNKIGNMTEVHVDQLFAF